MSESHRYTHQFLTNLGVVDTTLPLDLSAFPLSSEELDTFFAVGEWHILGLNVLITTEGETLSLPENIVENLVTLIIDGNQLLSNADIIGQCTKLHNLSLNYTNKITDYTFMSKLTRLRSLHLTHAANFSIKDIPTTLEELTNLNLSFTNLEGELKIDTPKLRSLSLNSTNITSLNFLVSTPNLQHLTIKKCSQLISLDGVEYCIDLKSLDATNCALLGNINSLAFCKILTTLKLKGCTELTDVAALKKTLLLQHLELNCADTMTNMPLLRYLPKLRTLKVGYCTNLDFIVGVHSLRNLKLDHIESLEELFPLPKLQRLTLDNIILIFSLAKLRDIPSLSKLTIRNCPRLNTLRGISVCTKLKELSISSCPELDNLDGAQNCYNLEDISLTECNIRDVNEPIQCYNLYINKCANFVGLNLNEQCVQLLTLIIEKCPLLVDLTSLQQCTDLEILHLQECPQLKKILYLANTKVRDLSIQTCHRLTEISPAPDLEMVEIMDIASPNIDCFVQKNWVVILRTDRHFDASILTQVTKLELSHQEAKNVLFLKNCINLNELHLTQCPNLTSLEGLPSTCTDLELIECKEITSLQGIEKCKQLRFLNLERCPLLKDISSVYALSSLFNIFIEACPLLQDPAILESLQNHHGDWRRKNEDFVRLE